MGGGFHRNSRGAVGLPKPLDLSRSCVGAGGVFERVGPFTQIDSGALQVDDATQAATSPAVWLHGPYLSPVRRMTIVARQSSSLHFTTSDRRESTCCFMATSTEPFLGSTSWNLPEEQSKGDGHFAKPRHKGGGDTQRHNTLPGRSLRQAATCRKVESTFWTAGGCGRGLNAHDSSRDQVLSCS